VWIDMNKQVRDLIAICVLAAVCCVAAWAFVKAFRRSLWFGEHYRGHAAIRRLV
jgi:hypothetical protein